MTEFKISEAELAKRIGVNRSELKAFRKAKLEKGKDWGMLHSQVFMTPSASESCLHHIVGDRSGPLAYSSSKEVTDWIHGQDENSIESTPPANPIILHPLRGIVDVTFVKTYRNPHIVRGELQDGTVVRVRVRSNKNFRKGMVMPCRLISGDLFELARRCPKYPGRWG